MALHLQLRKVGVKDSQLEQMMGNLIIIEITTIVLKAYYTCFLDLEHEIKHHPAVNHLLKQFNV